MSILHSIISDYELKQLEEQLNYYEETIADLKLQLNEAPMDFASQGEDEWAIFDEASRRLQVAKKALGLANKLSKPEERSHHKKVVIGILNRLRALVNRLTTKLTREVQREK